MWIQCVQLKGMHTDAIAIHWPSIFIHDQTLNLLLMTGTLKIHRSPPYFLLSLSFSNARCCFAMKRNATSKCRLLLLLWFFFWEILHKTLRLAVLRLGKIQASYQKWGILIWPSVYYFSIHIFQFTAMNVKNLFMNGKRTLGERLMHTLNKNEIYSLSVINENMIKKQCRHIYVNISTGQTQTWFYLVIWMVQKIIRTSGQSHNSPSEMSLCPISHSPQTDEGIVWNETKNKTPQLHQTFPQGEKAISC